VVENPRVQIQHSQDLYGAGFSSVLKAVVAVVMRIQPNPYQTNNKPIMNQ
jgi:hypothetical protein